MLENSRPLEILIGHNIRHYRLMVGLTLNEVAHSLGISYQQLQKYEKGTNNINAVKLIKIARLLDVPLEYILSEKDAMNRINSKDNEQERIDRMIYSFRRLNDEAKESLINVAQSLAAAFNATV